MPLSAHTDESDGAGWWLGNGVTSSKAGLSYDNVVFLSRIPTSMFSPCESRHHEVPLDVQVFLKPVAEKCNYFFLLFCLFFFSSC